MSCTIVVSLTIGCSNLRSVITYWGVKTFDEAFYDFLEERINPLALEMDI